MGTVSAQEASCKPVSFHPEELACGSSTLCSGLFMRKWSMVLWGRQPSSRPLHEQTYCAFCRLCQLVWPWESAGDGPSSVINWLSIHNLARATWLTFSP